MSALTRVPDLNPEGEKLGHASAGTRLPKPRGRLSADVIDALAGPGEDAITTTADTAEDEALALWVLYELHYRGFAGVPDEREWDPALIALRTRLESGLETRLRTAAAPLVRAAAAAGRDVVTQLEHVVAHDGPSLSRYLHRDASLQEYREFLVQRSIYHLKESDAHAWALPRIGGPAKAALAELLYDEYGAGVAANLHQQLFADALADAGLDPTYGAYVDLVPAHTLELNNAMSLFGLHRRLRGASMGHLAAFEMTSSLPCRRYAQGAERLGLGPAVARYFDEHVEADAVHEQLASRSICGGLVQDDPALRQDVLLGAASCVVLDQCTATATLHAWSAGASSLLSPLPG